MTPQVDPTLRFVRHALIALGLAMLALLVWRIWYALLLGFGAVLIGVFLRHLARMLHGRTGLPMRPAVLLVAVALLGLLAGSGALAGAAVASEMNNLGKTLQDSIRQIQDWLAQTPWGADLLQAARQKAQGGGELLMGIPGFMFKALNGALGVVVVLFAGLYLALAPGLYTEGAVALAPKARQARLREVLATVANALWLWLLARFAMMVGVAVLTWLGLLLAGVPLALPLALVAGLLEFIPFFGPILSAVPILLVAMTDSPMTALQGVLVVLVIQQIEGNVMEPLVEQKAVSLPPALVLVAAVAFTLLFGPIGAVFASPLLLTAILGTKMLYMEDALGEDLGVSPENPKGDAEAKG